MAQLMDLVSRATVTVMRAFPIKPGVVYADDEMVWVHEGVEGAVRRYGLHPDTFDWGRFWFVLI